MNDLEQTERLWSDNARVWSEGIRDGLDVINNQFGLPFFVGRLPGLRGKTILDAGCGEGRSTRAIAQSEARMIGVDVSPKMLEFARLEEAQRPRGITYVEASCHSLDAIAAESIDVVTSYMSLMDMPDIDKVMLEFARILKPEGQILVMVRHPCFFTPGFSIYQSRTAARAGVTVSGYFDNSAYIDKFSFSGRQKNHFEILRFPYTLTRYVASLRNAGFALKDLQEPAPSESLCAAQPRLEFWRKHAAIFLFLHGELKKNAV